MATNDERFDFEAVLSTQAKDWACASDLQNLTRCFNNRNLAACQGFMDAFDRCTAQAPFPRKPAAADDGDDDDDDEEMAGGPVSKVAIALAPQVFIGDAPRRKTWLSTTLERLMPKIFTEGGDDDDDDGDDGKGKDKDDKNDD